MNRAATTRGLSSSFLSGVNPLRITGSTLPPQLLLMAKLVTIAFFLTGQWSALPGNYLPFVAFLGDLGSETVFRHGLQLVFALAALSLLTNQAVRVSCFVLAGVIFVAILGSRLYFENNRTFTACILLLAALSELDRPPVLVRAQVVLLYAAAGLNKLLDAGWRSGDFIDSWSSTDAAQSLGSVYATASSWLSPALVSRAIAWTVILAELFVAVAFLRRRLFPAAIWVGLGYHASLTLLTGRTFGMFLFAAAAAYLAFVDWPSRCVVVPGSGRAGRALAGASTKLEADGVVELASAQGTRLSIECDGRGDVGFAAARRLILYTPAFLVIPVVVLAGSDAYVSPVQRLAAAIPLFVLSPVFKPLGQWASDRLARRRLPA